MVGLLCAGWDGGEAGVGSPGSAGSVASVGACGGARCGWCIEINRRQEMRVN